VVANLKRRGFRKVWVLEGGMPEWQQADYPVEKK
jgi:rhodanese-related sulfurtransferase